MLKIYKDEKKLQKYKKQKLKSLTKNIRFYQNKSELTKKITKELKVPFIALNIY